MKIGSETEVRTRPAAALSRTSVLVVAVALVVSPWQQEDNRGIVPVVSYAAAAGPPVLEFEDSRATQGQTIRILVDPGHGGRDPGATGPTGLLEKDVALDVSKRLARRLRAHGWLVDMTRTSDVAVSLQRRAAMVDETKADLLVSVHVNAVPGYTRPLVETYYFRPGHRRHRYRQRYTPQQWEERTQIADESAQLAAAVQRAVVDQVRTHSPQMFDNGVRTRGFNVLRSVSVPAILAELTLVTVPDEENRLRTEAYRDKLALALATGIKSYLDARFERIAEASGVPAEIQPWPPMGHAATPTDLGASDQGINMSAPIP